MPNSNESQNKRIKALLDGGGSITPKEAYFKFDSLRLAARIFQLKELGMNIITVSEKDSNGKRYARYFKAVK